MSEFEGPRPDETSNPEVVRDEFVTDLHNTVERFFPGEYPAIDLRDYGIHDISDLNSPGDVIRFAERKLPPGEIYPSIKSLEFIFRSQGFVINYHNAPEFESNMPIRRTFGSVMAPLDGRPGTKQTDTVPKWTFDEIDVAIEELQIQMEGIDPNDAAFMNQVAGWDGEKFVTFQDRVNLFNQYKSITSRSKAANEHKAHLKQILQNTRTVFDLQRSNPEIAHELVLNKLRSEGAYTTIDGETLTLEEITTRMEQDPLLEQQIIIRELNKISAYEYLLRFNGLVY